MKPNHNKTYILLLILSLLTQPIISETIKISPKSPTANLLSSMMSTMNSGSQQKQQFNSMFNFDNIFSKNAVASPKGTGNNILQGSNNQMQGVNNKISGQNNSLIGVNTTIIGDQNKAFGVQNTIVGQANTIVKGNNNQIKGS